MKKLFLWLLVTSMIIVFSLVSCKAGEEAAVEEEAPVEEAPVEEAAVEEAAAEKSFEGEELTVIYMSTNYKDAAYAIEEEFEEMTGADVTILDSPYQTLYEKEFADLVTGGGSFDVMQCCAQWGGQFAPYLDPLEDYISNSSDWGSMDDFIPAVALACGDWQGVRTGIPMAADAYAIVYRPDLFEEAGIEMSKIDGVDYFATWEDLENAAKILTKDGMYGYTLEGEKSQLGCFWRARAWVLGGHMLSKDYKTALPEREIAVEALQMMIDLEPYMPPGYLTYDIFAEYNVFLQGEVAMAEVWPSYVRVMAEDPAQSNVVGKWALMPLPGGPARKSANETGTLFLGIPTASENKELAWEWIKYYTSEESQRRFLDEFGVGPTRTVIYKDPAVLEKHPDFQSQLITLETTIMRFKFAQSQETLDFADSRISDALSGSITAQEAIDQIAEFWTEKICNDPPEGQYTEDYLE